MKFRTQNLMTPLAIMTGVLATEKIGAFINTKYNAEGSFAKHNHIAWGAAALGVLGQSMVRSEVMKNVLRGVAVNAGIHVASSFDRNYTIVDPSFVLY